MLETTHHFVGDEYAKVFHLKAGHVIGQHTHKFNHDAALLCGTAVVTVGGISQTLKAPAMLNIERGKAHQIEAKTDILWACLWENVERIMDPDKFDQQVIE